MKALVISDIHDNLANLEALFTKVSDIKLSEIIVAGDICSLETLQKIALLFPVKIWAVAGNGDYLKNNLDDGQIFFSLKPFIFEIKNHKIGLAHTPVEAKNLWQENQTLDFIFYGHTHFPSVETWEKTLAINSGNLAGTRAPATYATIDFEKSPPVFKLHRLYE